MAGDAISPAQNDWVKDVLDVDPNGYGAAGKLDDGGGDQAKQAPAQPPAAGGRVGAVPIVVQENQVPVPCKGAADFSAESSKAMAKIAPGEQELFGYTKSDLGGFDYDTDTSGKVTSFTPKPATIMVYYTVGIGTWDQTNTDTIRQVEGIVQKHERHHQSDCETVINSVLGPDFMKSLIGQTAKDAGATWQKAVTDCRKQMRDLAKTLDAAEGMTTITDNGDGTFLVTVGGA